MPREKGGISLSKFLILFFVVVWKIKLLTNPEFVSKILRWGSIY